MVAADGQPLLAIEPRDELVVHRPALAPQQLVPPTIAEASALAGKGPQTLAQPLMIASALRRTLGHGARDPDQPAGTTA
jgi:hypothetical protein